MAEGKPATLWQRTKAFALDYILIASYLVLVVVFAMTLYGAFPHLPQILFTNPISGQFTGFLLVTLPVTLYYARQESSSWQGSWGKHKIGLHVTSVDGQPLTFAHALGRTLLKFVPWELSHTMIWQVRFAEPGSAGETIATVGFVVVWLLIVANLLCLWRSKHNQTLYDWLARTMVVDAAMTIHGKRFASEP